MPNQPTSFRYPFVLPDDIHEGVRNALRVTFNGVVDLKDAIRALNTKVEANKTSITNITNTTVSGGGSSPPPPTPTFGSVNLQPNLTPGAYTLAQSDFAGLILVQSAIPFALTLNSGLVTPFFATVYNLGTGTITGTPSLGNVNNGAFVTLTTNEFGIFYFDGINWWEVFPILAQTEGHIASNWLDSYDANSGLFTRSQPSASDLTNGTTGNGRVVLDSGATVTSLTAVHETMTGVTSILGLGIYANNASAISGGLGVGNLYRTGADPDIIAVVH